MHWKKGGSPLFPTRLEDIVADHQQLKSAIGAAAISSTHSHLIVRQSSWCLPSWNQVQPPSCWQGSIVSPPAAPTAYGFAGSVPFLLPEMILRLLCGIVNAKRAETRSQIKHEWWHYLGIPSRVSARVLYQKIQSPARRSLNLYY
jgi:hypothetical protein